VPTNTRTPLIGPPSPFAGRSHLRHRSAATSDESWISAFLNARLRLRETDGSLTPIGRLGTRVCMFNQLNGTTRLFPIIGDPVKYAESPLRLTRTFEARGQNAIRIPMQVTENELDAVIAGLAATGNVDGILRHNAAQVRCVRALCHEFRRFADAWGCERHPAQSPPHLAKRNSRIICRIHNPAGAQYERLIPLPLCRYVSLRCISHPPTLMRRTAYRPRRSNPISGLKSGVPWSWLGVVEANTVELILAGKYRLTS
jgi:hypothetical protein